MSIIRSALILVVLGLGVFHSAAAQAVEEGLIIRQLKFTGNKSFDATSLEAAISTTNSNFFARNGLVRWIGLGAKRRFNEREFRRDVARLRLFYQIHGFLEAQVDTSVIRTPKDAYITFRVTEGLPVLVRSFVIKGLDTIAAKKAVIADLPLKESDPFDRTLVLSSADTIATRLQNRGYPEARVLLEKRDIDRVARTADLSLLVEPGLPAVIGEIHVVGAERVDSTFVRQLLATAPGRPFSTQDLGESQRLLYRSELFRFAAVRLDTAHYVPNSGVVPLTIQVAEGTMHRARASVGYGTNDCFRTGLGWTARNALGHGQIFDVSGQVSKLGVGTPTGVAALRNSICSALKDDSIGSTRVNYNITTSFRRPVFLSSSNSLTGSLFAERRSEFAVYLREDVGGSVTLLRETRKRLPISFTYRLSYGRTEANNVSFCAFFNACTETDISQLRQRRLLATFTVGAQRTRVNNPLDPSRGTALSAEVTHSSKVIGSSEFAQFTRVLGDAALYRPVGSSVLALHIRAGAVFSPRLVLDGGAANFVPPEQRFYAGGPNDVRGYNRNELGPIVYVFTESDVDSAGTIDESKVRTAATGGNTLIVANAEFRVPSPIFKSRFRLAAFVDAGSVWERGAGAANGLAIKVTPGAGLRFVTPLGPARIDVAYNGYSLPPGRLYLLHPAGDLELVRNQYQRTQPNAHWVLQLGVGQAF